jgi:hypothetical protein
MDRSVGGWKACNSDMNSLDLNRLVKEAGLLKQATEILEGVDANCSDVSFKLTAQVKQMREELHALKILVGKQAAQIETCKVWWTLKKIKSLILLSEYNPFFRSHTNRRLIMGAILLLYESIITKDIEALFMCWYLLMVTVL